MNNNLKSRRDRQEGNAMLITTIILAALLIIVAATINMSGKQISMAILKRNTSNTYHLAKSAIEKQVSMMNQTMEEHLIYIVDEMNTSSEDGKNYITQLIYKGSNIEYVPPVINSNGVTQKKGILKVDNTVIKEHIYKSLREALTSEYVSGESLLYKAQGDRSDKNNETEVKINVIDITDVTQGGAPVFKVVATAATMDGDKKYDEQIVEAVVEVKLPNEIIHQINERYEYNKEKDGTEIIPDILKGAITCYSDVIIGGIPSDDFNNNFGNNESSLKVIGDIYVGGRLNIENYGTSSAPLYPEPDQNGGLLVVNDGDLTVDGSVYTTRNILTTGGWENSSYSGATINISGDAVAHTIGIVDDFYKNSKNQSPFTASNQVRDSVININGNAMVDNDVMIDRWVRDSSINVTGSIYGINSGSDNVDNKNSSIDPNKSSGVFSQGPSSQITAHQMFVAGQPYIILSEGQKPLKLWESIGEPFDGIASYEGYATGDDDIRNADYLLPSSPFHNMISADKIKTTFDKTYATAKVSGIDIGDNNTKKVGQECTNILINQSQATQFFSQGGSSIPFASTVNGAVNKNADATYIAEVQKIMDNIDAYYMGKESGTVKKINGIPPTHNYRGVRGFMTVKRSMLYKEFDGDKILPLTFDEATKGMLPGGSNPTPIFLGEHDWSYKTPIQVIKQPGTVNISHYYLTDEDGSKPYPTIIINTSQKPITIEADLGKKEFNGVIISNGPVHINKDILIKGSVIIGTPEVDLNPKTVDRRQIFSGKNKGLTVGENVNIRSDSSIILKVRAENKDLYRAILDMLGVTHYDEYVTKGEGQIKNIIGMEDHHMYGRPVLNFSRESVLELNTEGMEMVITGFKKAH